MRRQVITGLEKNKTEPNSLAPRKVQQMLSPYDKDDIRYVMTIEEEIAMYEETTIEQIRQLHAEYLGNQAGELAIVGNFDVEPTLEKFRSIVEGWEAKQPFERIVTPAQPDIPGAVVTIETPDKSNALLYSGQQYKLADSDPEYASLVLGNFILGGGSLSSRLANRVRQQEGLSYGVRSGLTAANFAEDEKVSFTLYAITNPANKDKLLRVIREEVVRVLEDGVTEEELEQAKGAYLQAERIGRTGDSRLASMLVKSVFNDRTMAFVAEHEEQIQAATVDSVNAALKKYVDLDGLVMAIAGDFAAVEQPAE